MNRHYLSFVLSIVTFAVGLIATASPADAQLFRRWRASRQPAATPQYQQQIPQQQLRNQQYQQQRKQQLRQQPSPQRYQPNIRPSVPSSGKPQPSANYSRVPQVLGPIRFPSQSASPSVNGNPSRTPTLAEPPKKVSDNLDSPDDDEANSSGSSAGDNKDEADLGQSILSQDDPKDSEPKASNPKEVASSAAATMGLEVFQHSTPQNGVRIARINEQSKADESGLQVGDMIVAVDRTRTRSAKDIASILKQHQPGSSLRVQFVRGTTSYVTNVPLIASRFSRDAAADEAAKQDRVAAAKPPIPVTSKPPTASPQSQSRDIKLGMLIQDPASLRGTVVTKVRPGSIADASGLKEGDRIVSVESRLLEGGDRLREIISELTWGDQLAMGIVRDGELISRKVKLAQTPDKKLANTNAAKKSTQKTASNLGKGLGSMLGGLFGGNSGGSSQANNQDAQDASKVVNAGGEMPQPAEPAANADDPLGFGDDEPIEQVIFQKKTAAR